MTLKVVVIGLGQIGMTSDLDLGPAEHIYSHTRAFDEHPSFELVGGIDGDAQRRAQFERVYGKPAFEKIDSEIGALHPDVVAIAVPTSLHASVLRQVLLFCRPRAILCEKPLSYDLEEAREIVSLCKQFNCQLYVNYIRRSDLAVSEIKSRIERGDIEVPVKGIAWYSKGLFNNGSHFFDLLQYWLGDMRSFQVVQQGRTWSGDPEPDVLVHFEHGQIHFLAAKEENFSYYAIELVSASGRLRYDHGGEHVLLQQAVKSEISAGYTVLESGGRILQNGLSRIQWHVSEQLSIALSGASAAICTGDEALRTIEHLTSIKNAL